MTKIPEILTTQFYQTLLEKLPSSFSDFQPLDLAVVTISHYADLSFADWIRQLSNDQIISAIILLYSAKWQRIQIALDSEYNPIYNYFLKDFSENFREDGGSYEYYENWSENKTGTEKVISADASNESVGKTVTNIFVDETGATYQYTAGDEVKNSGYVTSYDDQDGNLNDFSTSQGQSSQINTLQDLHIYDISETKSGTLNHALHDIGIQITTPVSNINLQPTDAEVSTHTRDGNIGVTTTQQMITQEIEMRSRFQLEKIMIDDCVEFCSGGVWS